MGKKKRERERKNAAQGARINFTFPQSTRLQRYARKCLPLKKHSSIRNVTWCRYPLLVITSRGGWRMFVTRLQINHVRGERENVSSGRERSGYIFLRGDTFPMTNRVCAWTGQRTEIILRYSRALNSPRSRSNHVRWKEDWTKVENQAAISRIVTKFIRQCFLNEEGPLACDLCKVQLTVERVIVGCRKYIVNRRRLNMSLSLNDKFIRNKQWSHE